MHVVREQGGGGGRFMWIVLVLLLLLFLVLGALISTREAIVRQICKTRWLPLKVRLLASKFLPQDWLVIFVHGTYGSTMSLLDISTINNDRVEGSNYKILVDKMRNNPLFWRDQAVLGRGLIYVDSYSSPRNEGEALSGAHCIIRSFVEIDKLVGQTRTCHTYTYGWSGLLSQQRRRKEAIRFYNEISQELERLEIEEGILNPKVEIIAHSHGGNVALNLAGVRHMLSGDLGNYVTPSNEVVAEFEKEFKRLKPREDKDRRMDGQHKFDYIPDNKNLFVDRLIMMGTPVQPKTYGLAASPMFGQVFNIYSEQDGVQTMDYISCCSDTENRKFKLKEEMDRGNVYQVKISVCSDQVLRGSKEGKKEAKGQELSWWQVFIGMKDFSRKSWDPTHKELWFLVADMVPDEPEVLKPLPVVAFIPLIVYSILEEDVPFRDVDLDISVLGNKLVTFVAEHDKGNYRLAKSIPNSFVRRLASQAMLHVSGKDDMEKTKAFIQGLVSEWKEMQLRR